MPAPILSMPSSNPSKRELYLEYKTKIYRFNLMANIIIISFMIGIGFIFVLLQ